MVPPAVPAEDDETFLFKSEARFWDPDVDNDKPTKVELDVAGNVGACL